MKIKSLIAMMMAAVAIVVGMSSCSSDDDEPEMALAAQVVGSYTGTEVITIMGEPEEDNATFVFSQSSETTIDMTIPQSGEGMMVIPPLTVKNIPLSKVNQSIMGKLGSFAGTVTTANGSEKAFTVSNVTVIFEDAPKGKAVVASFTLKYGNMPFDMVTTFTGNKE